MGIFDWINDHGDEAAESIEGAVEWLGDRTEDGLRWTADRAEDIGFETGRDYLNGAATEVANITGAEIDELELGQTQDPKALIIGEPPAIDGKAESVRTIGDSLSATADALSAIDVSDWEGEGADAFRALWSKEPGYWDDAQAAFAQAADAMNALSDSLTSAQNKAQTAIDKWNEAERLQQAFDDLPDDDKESSALDSEAADLRAEAKEFLADGRLVRDTAVGVFASAMNAARDMAPETPPFINRLGMAATDAATWTEQQLLSATEGFLTAASGTVAFVRSVNPTSSYNVSHPWEYLERMTDLGSGLVVAVADPGAVVTQIIDDFKQDPSKAIGGLAFEAATTIATGGAAGPVKFGASALGKVDKTSDAVRAADRVAESRTSVPRKPGSSASSSGELRSDRKDRERSSSTPDAAPRDRESSVQRDSADDTSSASASREITASDDHGAQALGRDAGPDAREHDRPAEQEKLNLDHRATRDVESESASPVRDIDTRSETSKSEQGSGAHKDSSHHSAGARDTTSTDTEKPSRTADSDTPRTRGVTHALDDHLYRVGPDDGDFLERRDLDTGQHARDTAEPNHSGSNGSDGHDPHSTKGDSADGTADSDIDDRQTKTGAEVADEIFDKPSGNLKGRFGEFLTRAWLKLNGYEIIAESPRLFVEVDGKLIETRPDFIVVDRSGELVAYESKLGPNAGFTKNQKLAFPELADGAEFRVSAKSDLGAYVKSELSGMVGADGRVSGSLIELRLMDWNELKPSLKLIREASNEANSMALEYPKQKLAPRIYRGVKDFLGIKW